MSATLAAAPNLLNSLINVDFSKLVSVISELSENTKLQNERIAAMEKVIETQKATITKLALKTKEIDRVRQQQSKLQTVLDKHEVSILVLKESEEKGKIQRLENKFTVIDKVLTAQGQIINDNRQDLSRFNDKVDDVSMQAKIQSEGWAGEKQEIRTHFKEMKAVFMKAQSKNSKVAEEVAAVKEGLGKTDKQLKSRGYQINKMMKILLCNECHDDVPVYLCAQCDSNLCALCDEQMHDGTTDPACATHARQLLRGGADQTHGHGHTGPQGLRVGDRPRHSRSSSDVDGQNALALEDGPSSSSAPPFQRAHSVRRSSVLRADTEVSSSNAGDNGPSDSASASAGAGGSGSGSDNDSSSFLISTTSLEQLKKGLNRYVRKDELEKHILGHLAVIKQSMLASIQQNTDQLSVQLTRQSEISQELLGVDHSMRDCESAVKAVIERTDKTEERVEEIEEACKHYFPEIQNGAQKQYVDLSYQDVLKKLRQLEKNTAKALKTEMKRFERDVMVFIDDERMGDVSESAAARVHFRCLSCNQKTSSQHPPHSTFYTNGVLNSDSSHVHHHSTSEKGSGTRSHGYGHSTGVGNASHAHTEGYLHDRSVPVTMPPPFHQHYTALQMKNNSMQLPYKGNGHGSNNDASGDDTHIAARTAPNMSGDASAPVVATSGMKVGSIYAERDIIAKQKALAESTASSMSIEKGKQISIFGRDGQIYRGRKDTKVRFSAGTGQQAFNVRYADPLTKKKSSAFGGKNLVVNKHGVDTKHNSVSLRKRPTTAPASRSRSKSAQGSSAKIDTLQSSHHTTRARAVSKPNASRSGSSGGRGGHGSTKAGDGGNNQKAKSNGNLSVSVSLRKKSYNSKHLTPLSANTYDPQLGVQKSTKQTVD